MYYENSTTSVKDLGCGGATKKDDSDCGCAGGKSKDDDNTVKVNINIGSGNSDTSSYNAESPVVSPTVLNPNVIRPVIAEQPVFKPVIVPGGNSSQRSIAFYRPPVTNTPAQVMRAASVPAPLVAPAPPVNTAFAPVQATNAVQLLTPAVTKKQRIFAPEFI